MHIFRKSDSKTNKESEVVNLDSSDDFKEFTSKHSDSSSLELRRKMNRGIKYFLMIMAIFASLMTLFITLYLIIEALPVMTSFRQIRELLFDNNWNPKEEHFGAFNLLLSSLIVTFYAIIIAVPFGIGIGILMAEFLPQKSKKIVKPTIEIISAIPSVIMGLIAFRYLAMIIQQTSFALGLQELLSSGRVAITASITLAFMTVPMIASLTDDALSAVPSNLKKASLALGSSNWEAVSKVSLPHARSSIISAIILAFGRVIGETMVVLMVVSNNPALNKGWFNPFQEIYALPSAIAGEVGDIVIGDAQWSALFFLGLELLFVSLIITTIGRNIATGKISFKFITRMFKKEYWTLKENKHSKNDGYFKLFTMRLRKTFTRKVPLKENKDLNMDTRNKSKVKIGRFFDDTIQEKEETINQTKTELRDYYSMFRKNSSTKKKITERTFKIIFYLLLGMIIGALLIVFGVVVYDGVQNLWPIDFIQGPSYSYMQAGHYGYLKSAIGTIIVVGTAALIGLPISTFAGIYLYFYIKPTNRFCNILRNGIQNISTIPSVVVGLFGWGIFVNIFGWGKSILAGGFTLMIMMIPIATSTTIEALKQVPFSMRHNALALGSTKWESIKDHNLRYSFPSIVTGYLFSISRVIGETAPIILTVAASVYSPSIFPDSLINTGVSMLPFDIYILGLFTDKLYPNSFSWAMTCALILLLLAIGLFIIGQILRSKFQVKYE
jgi:phosphate ABC transporter permease protein PstC/phosphate ABC transporter permease subunit PstA